MERNFFSKWFKKSDSNENAEPDAFLINSEILEQVEYERAVYLEALLKQLDSLRSQGIAFKSEVDQHSLEQSKKSAQVPLRVDALYEDGGEIKTIEANLANAPFFDTMTEDWDDIMVTLQPFVWNAVEFHVIGPMPDVEQLGNWINRWFDPKNRNRKNADKLRAVIHKISAPTAIEDGWMVTIDFGSAGIEAFTAFFKQCRFNEAEAISINSQQYFELLKKNHSFTSSSTMAAITTTPQPI